MVLSRVARQAIEDLLSSALFRLCYRSDSVINDRLADRVEVFI